MEKKVTIGEKTIDFKANASTPLRYRSIFKTDLLKDMERLQKDNSDTTPVLQLAYVMAKQANPSIDCDVLDWLDQFEMVPFYQAMPEILALWGENNTTLETSKKK